MSISSNTISELEELVSQLDFLLSVPNIDIEKIPADERKCSICHDPFDNNSWKAGETANVPVKLDCGHIFGIQCLARLVFTVSISSRCPFCRAPIIPNSARRLSSKRSWEVAFPLLRLFTGLGRQLTTAPRVQILKSLQSIQPRWSPVAKMHMVRTIILYEEVLNEFCNHPPEASDRDRLLALEFERQEIAQLVIRNQELRTQLEELRQSVQKGESEIQAEARIALLKEPGVAQKIHGVASMVYKATKTQLSMNKRSTTILMIIIVGFVSGLVCALHDHRSLGVINRNHGRAEALYCRSS